MGGQTAHCARIYRPRRPRESPLYQLLDRYCDQFERDYDQRYQKRYGFWRPVIAKTVDIAAGRRCLNKKTPRLRRPQGGLRPRAVPEVPLRVLCDLHLPQALFVPELPPEARPSRRRAHRP